jgi:hypothetical protein
MSWKPRTEDDISCDWKGPAPDWKGPAPRHHWCGRRARYFYIDVLGNLCARCYEHRFIEDAKIITKDEFLVQALMDL